MEIVQNNKILQRFVLGFLLLVLVVTPLLAVQLAQAQEGGTSEAIAPTGSMYEEWVGEAKAEALKKGPMYDGGGGVTDTPPAEAAAAAKARAELNPLTALGNLVGNMVLDVASRVTWLGGKILEVSMEKLVIGMGDMINNKGLGIVIHQAWTTVRDICNLAFIFGFIYIGIKTIIDADSGSSKKFLASIIMGAVLINFSLFFTKAIIDVSNYLAVEINNAMLEGSGSISMKMGDILKIESIYSTPGKDPALLAKLTDVGSIAYFVMGALFLIIAGFVLAVGGILLIFRFVQLVFIMIFSPILFAATVFPQTSQYSGMLMSKLLGQAFFAPVYLFLLLISIKLLSGMTTALGVKGKTMSTALTSSSADSFDVILMFIICIMFLVMSLKAAQQMGAIGAEKALALGKDLRMRGQHALGSATSGLAAASGRATFGKWANNISEREGLKDAASKSGIRGFAARQALKSSRVVGDSSFDARNVAGVGKALGVGEGRKGGYKTVKEEVKKKEEEFARSLGEVKDDDVFVEARKNEISGEEKKVDKHKEELLDLREKKKLAQAARDVVEENRLSVLIDDKKIEIEKQEKAVADAKLKYESEKQRRIIGSTYAKHPDQATLDAQSAEIKRMKGNLKLEWERYVALPDEARKEAYRPNIEAIKANLKAKQDERDELLRKQPDRGYAGVLEKSSRITAWPAGRLAHVEQSAGIEIRKSAEKGLPKEK